MVIAIIAAAGQGTRLGADLPKAYVELAGRTLMERSVRAMIDAVRRRTRVGAPRRGRARPTAGPGGGRAPCTAPGG